VAILVLRKSLLAGVREASGLTVVIDVFRAFSCAPILFRLGIKRLVLEPDPDRALTLKTGDQVVLVGEMEEKPIPGFDLCNSPTEIMKRGRVFFEGKTVIQRTTAGVQGVKTALENSDEVLLGSFLTAQSTATFIYGKIPPPRYVTLVAMGIRAMDRAPEDEACADYLEHLLSGTPYDHLAAVERIVFQETAQKFLRGDRSYLPREDTIFCLQRDLFDFALSAEKRNGLIEASMMPVKCPVRSFK
jgi:2-phosphosulfolactate phosphatase